MITIIGDVHGKTLKTKFTCVSELGEYTLHTGGLNAEG